MALSVYPQFIRGISFPVMKTAQFDTTYMSAPNKYAVTVPNTINPFWHWTLVYNYLKDDPNDVVAIYSPNTDYRTMQGFYLAQGGMNGVFLFSDPTDNSVGPAIQTTPWQANRLYVVGAIIVDPAGHAQQATAVTGPSGWTIPTFNDSGGNTTDVGVAWHDTGVASGPQPNPNAQLQVVTDGTFYYSPLQRNFGSQFLEDVTDLNTISLLGGSSLAVYANGVLQTGGTCGVGSPNYQLSGPGLATPTASFMGLYLKWCSGAPTPPVTAQFNFFFRARFELDELDFEQFLGTVWTIGGPDTKNGAGYVKLESARPNPL